ncbi:MAG: hypothetical protein KDB00_17685 [Planctomycetales bacterium]|nr:hypothetical protein [Planctomycetales bacterium]
MTKTTFQSNSRLGNTFPARASANSNRARASFANATGFLVLTTFSIFTCGCGSKSDQASAPQSGAAEQQITQKSAELEPTEIVSQFLDLVRRGGQDASSNELLTKLAQQELKRIGRPFEFPGSPDTTFEVRQAFPVPDHNDMVWVHTYLTEPSQTGESLQYEVVWTLRKETVGWRVSGFVIDQGDGLEPLQFDFENGDEMAARLASLESTEEPVNR